MPLGVFGKVPARRDYVRHRVEPGLMEMFDPWLQSAVAESRGALGACWLDAYLAAPIWRFWIGGGVAGRTVLGALMPSVDGVGRYFPLCAIGAYRTEAPPPDVAEHAAWFDRVEPLMLAALAEDGTYEELTAGLDAVPPPGGAPGPAPDGTEVPAAFARLRRAIPAASGEGLSCWWVPSPDGGATPPRAMVRRGLPAPVEYAAMIAQDRVGDPSPALGGA